MRHARVVLSAVMAVTCMPGWSQTTTGRLMGTTVDESGAVLQGVNVSIDSPALIGGSQVKTTDGRGEFVFLALPPGDYQVRTERAGFVSQERRKVTVPLGGAAVLSIAMPVGAFSGEIEVRDETPVVDPTQISSGPIFRSGYMQSSAIGSHNRSYLTVINQTAGVVEGPDVSGVSQSKVFGSTIGENAYFIDGMDATNPTTAAALVVLNFDAIGEIQLQTGGFEAEYGRATGGIINLVSKSGGNLFSGTFDARYRDQAFQESGDYFDTGELSTKYQNFAATLGGPILRDKVWFFASYQRINDVFTPIASPTTRDEKGQNYLGKITWQIAPAWRLAGKYTSAPMTIDNWGASRWRMPEATGLKKGTTAILSTELTSVLSDSVLWNTTVGAMNYWSDYYPMNPDLSAIGHYNNTTGLYTFNYGTQADWKTSRNDFTTDLTYFVDGLAGSHELKAGIEYSDLLFTGSECSTGTPNGDPCVENGVGFFFGDIEYGGQAVPWLMAEYHTAGPADYDGTVSTAFVQDAWRPVGDLTLKIGLRYDAVTYDSTGARIADMDMFQPRLGIAWDIGGDAKNVLRGSWGRFMHPNMLALPYWVPDRAQPSYYWYSCSGFLPLQFGIAVGSPDECAAVAAAFGSIHRTDNAGWDPFGWVLGEVYASEPNQTAPGLRATYADELILGFEREVGNRSSIELTFIDKQTRDIVDDTCNGNWPTPSAGAACDYYILANIPELRRDYRGATLTYETRGLAWLTLLASYTYSSSKGSVEYTQNAGNVVDLYPWQFENIYGYLSDHRQHRIKLNGFFNIRGDWTIAFDARWASPFTWTPYENSFDNPDIPNGNHNLEPRGSREANNQHQLDLQLSKGFTTGRVRFVLIGTVLNALSSEQPTAVCEHISGCGAFEMGEATNWQVPRRYEVGVRLEF